MSAYINCLNCEIDHLHFFNIFIGEVAQLLHLFFSINKLLEISFGTHFFYIVYESVQYIIISYNSALIQMA